MLANVLGSVVYSNRYKCNVGFYGTASNSFSNYWTTKPSSGGKKSDKKINLEQINFEGESTCNKFIAYN